MKSRKASIYLATVGMFIFEENSRVSLLRRADNVILFFETISDPQRVVRFEEIVLLKHTKI